MLTDEEQLTMLIDRWASRRGPFPEAHGAVVCELEDVTSTDPVTLDYLQGYIETFVTSLGSVYTSLRHLDHHLGGHIAVCRFAFGKKAVAGELREVGAALTAPLIRFEASGPGLSSLGSTLLIAKPAKRYQWIQAAAILDADEVFGQLVEMGF